MTALESLDLKTTALLLVDLQNDFLHPDGAYARGDATAPAIAELPGRLVPIVGAARSASIPVIATLFTLVPSAGGPLISDHLRLLRPFLGDGDFAPGSWGQSLVDELAPADITIEKVTYSAFHASRLEFVLGHLGVTSLIAAGIVTNGGVASTVRAAHVLNLDTIVLTDGCASFTEAAHDAAIGSLATISAVATCAEIEARIS